MLNEQLEIKVGPAKCFLNTLGYTISGSGKHDTYQVFDENEKYVGQVSIGKGITEFKVKTPDISIKGDYRFDQAFNNVRYSYFPANRFMWDVNFEIEGRKVNYSKIKGILSLQDTHYDFYTGFVYKGNMEFEVNSRNYQWPVKVSMMSNGSILKIEDMIDQDGNEDNIRFSFYKDTFDSYVSHVMRRFNNDGKPVDLIYTVYSKDNNKGNVRNIKSAKTYLEQDENGEEVIRDYVCDHLRFGDDESYEEYENKASIINLTGSEMKAVIEDFSNNISSQDFRIIDKFAGLLYKYSFNQILLSTSINKEPYKTQNCDPRNLTPQK